MDVAGLMETEALLVVDFGDKHAFLALIVHIDDYCARSGRSAINLQCNQQGEERELVGYFHNWILVNRASPDAQILCTKTPLWALQNEWRVNESF